MLGLKIELRSNQARALMQALGRPVAKTLDEI